MSRRRLDKVLVEMGLVPSRERARARIMAGHVRLNGEPATKAGHAVREGDEVELIGDSNPFVSRGGLKLRQALDAFDLPIEGRVAMDVGASTGGFTDCLLLYGIARVYAVDVGYGQLAWKLRTDERVVVHERTNIRHLEESAIPEPIDVATIDCSFIGLAKVVPPLLPFLARGADVVALVKPQFEAGPEGVGRGGVVRDQQVRDDAIARVRTEMKAHGLQVIDGVDCDTHGPSGNVEYLLHARRPLGD